jgi:hypothetical protein
MEVCGHVDDGHHSPTRQPIDHQRNPGTALDLEVKGAAGHNKEARMIGARRVSPGAGKERVQVGRRSRRRSGSRIWRAMDHEREQAPAPAWQATSPSGAQAT